MNILYCGDDYIRDGLTMSVLSLLGTTSEPVNIYILTAHITTDGRTFTPLSRDYIDFLSQKVRRQSCRSSIELIDVTELYNSCPPTANLATRFTPYCMLRLFADMVDTLPDRLLYLDADTLCRRDISLFYHQDMQGAELAGVLDYYGSHFFRRNIFRRDYLNSGVLLLDLELIRKTGLFAASREMCRTKRMFMPDQSALNKLARKKKLCHRRFNEQRRLRRDTVVQHFTTTFRFFPCIHTVSVKPWDAERMHSVLRLHEYDDLLRQLDEIKNEYRTKGNKTI